MAPRVPHRFSKFVGRRAVALQFATVAVFAGTSAYAEIANNRPVSKEELKAKLTYCENCHGASAQGFHGYYPIPRLAGQQPDYVKNQLEAFVERRRTNNIMFNQ
jgi:cytochrome c553